MRKFEVKFLPGYRPMLLMLGLISNFVLTGQTLFGTLIDETSGEAIPFGNVQIGSEYGVISNEEGSFSMELPGHPIADSLRFLSLGYISKTIAIKDFIPGKVYLRPQMIQLEEVFLDDERLSARQVMDSVRKNLSKNHRLPHIGFMVFNRTENAITPHEARFEIRKTKNLLDKKNLQKLNQTMDSLSEEAQGYTSVSYHSFLGQAVFYNQLKMRLEKADFLLNQEKNIDLNEFTLQIMAELAEKMGDSDSYHVRSGLFNIGDSIDVSSRLADMESGKADSIRTGDVKNRFKKVLQSAGFDSSRKANSGLNKRDFLEAIGSIPDDFIRSSADYSYEIEEMIFMDNRYVYKITFWPKRNIFGNKGIYTGTLYISKVDFGILRAEYDYAEGEHGKKISMGLLFGVRFEEKLNSGVIIYQQSEEGFYFPKYIKYKGESYARMNRSFVVKENTKDRKNRTKMKLKMLLDFDSGYQEEWLISDEKPITSEDFNDFVENKGVEEQKTNTFDSKIWENNNTIMPTKAILKFGGTR